MNENPNDNFKNLEDVLRHIMEMTEEGRMPVFIGMKIVIPGDGSFPGPQARGDSTEPEIEIQRVEDHIKLVTELPGMSPENIHVLFRDDRVFIWARDEERQYRTSAKVPPAEKDSMEIRIRNGILEVSYLPSQWEAEKNTAEE
jgi:HSP20 family molecular chaperone IbpA